MMPLKISLILCSFFLVLQAFAGPTTTADKTKLKEQSETTLALLRQDFENKIRYLRELGVNVDRKGLEYLAAELFYNIPTRQSVFSERKGIIILDSLPYIDHNKYKYRLTNGDFLRADLSSFRGIQISGNKTSYFAWDPKSGEYFIYKLTNHAKDVNALSLEILELKKAGEVPDLEFALELMMEPQPDASSIIRPLKKMNDKNPNTSAIYPFHGFLGSIKILEAATSMGISVKEYMWDVLIPKLADLAFTTNFEMGLLFAHHTQNLWISFNDFGVPTLYLKDFNDVARMTLLADAKFASMHKNLEAKELGREAYADTGSDIPRSRDPAFHFAQLGLQSILLSGPFSLQDQASLFKRFFDQLIKQINSKKQMEIKFSRDVQWHYDHLETMSHEYDIRLPRVAVRNAPMAALSGLYLLAFHMYDEILEQVQIKQIGELNPVESREAIKAAKAEFSKNNRYYITRDVLPPVYVVGRPQSKMIKKYLSNPASEIANFFSDLTNPSISQQKKRAAVMQNENFIALIDKKTGKVFAVSPRAQNRCARLFDLN